MNNAAESRRCANCGQPVLRTDTVCWHCGTRLSLPEPVPVDLDGEQLAEESPLPLQQILFYTILTVVAALALLLVTRALGHQPQYIDPFNSTGMPLAALSAPDGSFSLELPADSTWYFPQTGDGRSDDASQLVDDPRFAAALAPLVNLVPDAQQLLLAESETGILSLARSERLGRLSSASLLASMRSESFAASTVSEAAIGKNRAGAEAAAFTVTQDDPALLCRQFFLPDTQGAYLAAACTTPDQFAERAPLLNAILESLVTR